LRDKTLQDHYSPGSTFKTITAIAALEEGVIDENTKIRCGGSIKVGKHVYHCWQRHGHGDINVVTALTQSCDVFFYRAAQKLKSVDDLAKWATRLGLGKKTDINLAREVPGLIPTEEWKRKRFGQEWNAGETLSVAIGQSFVLTTALQLANTYAAIGNGGTLWKPYIVKEIESYEGQVEKEYKPEKLSDFRLKPKTLELVKQGLWGAVNSPHGTAHSQRIPGIDFAGKTGTVQTVRVAAEKIYQKCESLKFRDRYNGVFAGMAPLKDPVIAVAVIGEHVCHGATGAGPIARAVIKTYLEKYYPKIYGEQAIAERLKKEGKSEAANPYETRDEDDVIVNEAPDLPTSAAPAPLAPAPNTKPIDDTKPAIPANDTPAEEDDAPSDGGGD
jgi:penicillin-binding protein 2